MTTKEITREEVSKIFGELTDKELQSKQKAMDDAMRKYGIKKKSFLRMLEKYKNENIIPSSVHLTVAFRNICK